MMTHLFILIVFYLAMIFLLALVPKDKWTRQKETLTAPHVEMIQNGMMRLFQGYGVWVFWNLLSPTFEAMPYLPYWHATGLVFLIAWLKYTPRTQWDKK